MNMLLEQSPCHQGVCRTCTYIPTRKETQTQTHTYIHTQTRTHTQELQNLDTRLSLKDRKTIAGQRNIYSPVCAAPLAYKGGDCVNLAGFPKRFGT